MARFIATRHGVAPLIIQLGTPSSITAQITKIEAAGENFAGKASHPIYFVPSTPGKGTGLAQPVNGIKATPAQCSVITNFTANPVFPTVTVGSFNLPIRVSYRFPQGQGLYLPPSTFGVLYQGASSGQLCSGSLEWEEP